MSRVSKVDVARQLRISPQYLHRVLKEGTCDPRRAAQLAVAFGGDESCYLRDGKPRGRPPKAMKYPFREFLRDARNLTTEECDRDRVSRLIRDLARRYNIYSGTKSATPYHVRDLEHLMACLKAMKLEPQQRLLAPAVWRRFRKWRLTKEYDAQMFDIDMEEDEIANR